MLLGGTAGNQNGSENQTDTVMKNKEKLEEYPEIAKKSN
jgi:hypothetical protein